MHLHMFCIILDLFDTEFRVWHDMTQKIVHNNNYCTSSYSTPQATSNNCVQLLLHVWIHVYSCTCICIWAVIKPRRELVAEWDFWRLLTLTLCQTFLPIFYYFVPCSIPCFVTALCDKTWNRTRNRHSLLLQLLLSSSLLYNINWGEPGQALHLSKTVSPTIYVIS